VASAGQAARRCLSDLPRGALASPPPFGRGAALAFLLAFLILGVAFTAPLVHHLGDSLPYAAVPPPGHEVVDGPPGDYLRFSYDLWLVRDRLLAGASFLRDPYQFAADEARPNPPNTLLPAGLLFVPLSAFGPRFAYNALVLLSFPFAGVAMVPSPGATTSRGPGRPSLEPSSPARRIGSRRSSETTLRRAFRS
jgi:hypothetical protein